MFSVSSSYKTQINKKLRNQSFIKIIIYDGDYSSTTKTGTELLHIDTSSEKNALDVVNCVWSREIDELNTKLPVESFQFTFIDKNKMYNPENPTSQWESIEKQAPVSFWFGYELDNGNIEWIKGSTYITSGQNDFAVENGICLITIKAESVISFLTAEIQPPEGTDRVLISGRYLDVINNVISNSTNPMLVNGWFSCSCGSESTSESITAFNSVTESDILQLSAQALQCNLKTDRDGNIKILPHSVTAETFKLDSSTFSNIPTCYKYPNLSELTISYCPISGGTATEESYTIYSGDYSDADDGDWINFSIPLTDLAYNATCISIVRYNSSGYTSGGERYIKDNEGNLGTLSISSDRKKLEGYFTYSPINAAKIKITYSFTSVIIAEQSINIKYAISTFGQPCSIKNGLVSSETVAQNIKKDFEYYLGLRNQYKGIEYRGNPEIDVGDIIHVQTFYNTEVDALVFKNEITFDGTLSGEISFYTIPPTT